MEQDNLYQFFFDEETMEGVWGASLVSRPAIDVNYIKFSKEWKFADEEKHVIVSPLLIPNQRIWRNELNGYVFADETTVEKLQQNFFKQGYNFNSKLEHDGELIKDVYFFESWIVEDPLNDKSLALGFKDLVKGTWMVSMKVDNKDIWDNYIKTGEVLGLSIDAFMGIKKVETKKIKQEMKKEMIEEIIRLSIQKVAMASDLVEYKLVDGSSVFASSLEVGSIITDVDGNPIVDKEVIIETSTYKTDEMGAIKEVEVVEEPLTEEEVVETELVDAVVETVAVDEPVVNPAIKELEDKISTMESIIKDLEEKNAKLEADVVSKENEVVQMKMETPANKGISNRAVELSEIEKPKTALGVIEAAIKKNNK